MNKPVAEHDADKMSSALSEKILQAMRKIFSLPNYSKISEKNPLRVLVSTDQGGYQPLHYAAASGDIDFLRLLLDIFRSFPTHWQQLISSGDRKGNSALHFAIERNFPEIIRILVQEAAINVNLANADGLTSLHLIASAPPSAYTADVARFLLTHGGDPSIPDANGTTPLHLAAATGNQKLLELFSEAYGVSLNVRDEEGESPLFYAVRGRHVNVIRYLFRYGAEHSLKNQDGETALEVADSIGDSEMVQLLESLIHPRLALEKQGPMFGCKNE